MFTTIVAGTDGEHGRGAAALAQRIAIATGARLHVVAVASELPVPMLGTYAQGRTDLDHELRALRDELAPDAHLEIAVDVSPAHALRRTAENHHADLVVVGSRQHGRFRQITAGDSTMQVLHGSPCAVAVAPDHRPPVRAIRRIGVGLDASRESTRALEMALELAQLAGAELWLLAVASDAAYVGSMNLVAGPSYPELYAETIDARVATARQTLRRALVCTAGTPTSGDVRVGDPRKELVTLSGECDLLVLGSRRWGAVRRLALGSTSEQVIRHAEGPVLVPPRGATSEFEDTKRRSTAAAAP